MRHARTARWRGLFAAIVLGLSAFVDEAAADTGSCSASASDVNFGSVTISSMASAATTGSISVTCPGGHGGYNPWAYCNSIGAGSNSASQSSRTMKSGSNAISYNLYVDASYNTAYTYLGNTIYTYPYNSSTGSTATNTIYAKILSAPAGIPPGTYTDSYTASSQALVNPDGAPSAYSAAETCTGTSGANWYNTLSFTVRAVVQASCSVSVNTLNFGSTAAPITGNIDATATITALCTATTPYSIGLGTGLNPNGSQRQMVFGSANYVSYGLYTDSSRSQAWSSGSSASSCTNGAGTCALGTGTGSNQSITIYGRVPPQTTPVAGTYNDTVVVTLTY